VYFEEREGYKLLENTKGYKKLIQIWKKQKGMCPICKLKITTETGWKTHNDEFNKKKIVHPKCHNAIHKVSVS
jgi:RNA-directed DNA polymerase